MVVGEFTQETDLLILGGGPGGYHAAFRAGEHGIQTTIVDESGSLGGVCLQRGCIPSKTYLHVAELLHLGETAAQMGIQYGKPKIDVDAVRKWKNDVVAKLIGGLDSQCKKYKVDKVSGRARFEDSKTVVLEGGTVSRIKFRRCIIAVGSKSMTLPPALNLDSPKVMGSRAALELESVPKTLLVIGGGYIGIELGQVYAALGSRVTVVEMLPSIVAGADADLVRPLQRRLESQFEQICVETKLAGLKDVKGGVEAKFEGKNPPKTNTFEKVLVSIGRKPNTADLGLDKTKVQVDPRGFIQVDAQFRTADPKIYAIGDCIGNPMLAHKALSEGRVLADILAGKNEVFDPRAIPAVVFTDPEIAWAGLTEAEAKAKNLDIVVKKIPWGASGRAVAIGRTDGMTKLIFDKATHRLIGTGMVGVHAGEMIAESVLALEMGATAYDLMTTIHPHPTLSEMVGEAAGMVE